MQYLERFQIGGCLPDEARAFLFRLLMSLGLEEMI